MSKFSAKFAAKRADSPFETSASGIYSPEARLKKHMNDAYQKEVMDLAQGRADQEAGGSAGVVIPKISEYIAGAKSPELRRKYNQSMSWYQGRSNKA